jgi:hypothetical protein
MAGQEAIAEDVRDINSLDELCTFELFDNTHVGGTTLNRFNVLVSYLMIKSIKLEGNPNYQPVLIGGEIAHHSMRHVFIPAPIPELAYHELPGIFHGVKVAESQEHIDAVRSATMVYIARRLQADNIFSSTFDVRVSTSFIETFETPKHMAFLISDIFNYAVGRLDFGAKGYGLPVKKDP